MKTRLFLLFTAVYLMMFTPIKPQKIQSTFLGCTFGMTDVQIKDVLKKSEINSEIGKSGNIYLKNVTLNSITYQTACMMFSPIDGTFYKLIGSNEFSSKIKADSCYEAQQSLFRGQYEKLQIIRKPQNAIKMCTYVDNENSFYLGFFKNESEDAKIVYYVNVNFWNNYFDNRIRENNQ